MSQNHTHTDNHSMHKRPSLVTYGCLGIIALILAIGVASWLWYNNNRTWDAYEKFMSQGEVALKKKDYLSAYYAFRSAGLAEDWQNTFFGTFNGSWQNGFSNTLRRMSIAGEIKSLRVLLESENYLPCRDYLISYVGSYGGEREISLLIKLSEESDNSYEALSSINTALSVLTGAEISNMKSKAPLARPLTHEAIYKSTNNQLSTTLSWINVQQHKGWNNVIKEQLDKSIEYFLTHHSRSDIEGIVFFVRKQLRGVYTSPDFFEKLRRAEKVDILSRQLSDWWAENSSKLEWDSKRGQMMWKKKQAPKTISPSP